jgi:lipopolysaccharide export system protein LptC
MRIAPAKRPLAFALLIIAAAASGWWLYRVDVEPTEFREPVIEEFDYYMSAFELAEMDAQGGLKHTLVAENLYHYPEREQSTLASPRLVFFEDDRRVWEISSDQGLIHDSDRSVFLSGGVHIQYASVQENRDFEVFTDELRVWPDIRLAETADSVRIVKETGVTWSTGMRAELDLRRIHLLSDVRGTYDPW